MKNIEKFIILNFELFDFKNLERDPAIGSERKKLPKMLEAPWATSSWLASILKKQKFIHVNNKVNNKINNKISNKVNNKVNNKINTVAAA